MKLKPHRDVTVDDLTSFLKATEPTDTEDKRARKPRIPDPSRAYKHDSHWRTTKPYTLKRRNFSRCPRCGAPTEKAVALNGLKSKTWMKCTAPGCKTYINTYIPQPHQTLFHQDSHIYRGNFGGYGSGKTTTTEQELYKHAFLTPNGNFLIGANIVPQYEQTIKRDIEATLPRDFVAAISKQQSYFDLVNGHRIIFRPLDDEGKLRSLTLSGFAIIEASEVKPELFTQLKTRTRSPAAFIQAQDEHGNLLYDEDSQGRLTPRILKDWRTGIIESNPDAGWIRTEVLLSSSYTQLNGDVEDQREVTPERQDPKTSSHISATNINRYLPAGFIEENSRNKPEWWVNRYLRGSFNYAEGLVYPGALGCVVPQRMIPAHFPRLIAMDYGLADPTVFIFAAVDPYNNKVIVYKDPHTNNQSIDGIAELYRENITDIPAGGIYRQLIDPKSGPRRDYNKRTLADHFLEKGILFEPGAINLDARIFRLNTYIESGVLEITDNCEMLLEELREYKYRQRQLGDYRDTKPEDKRNHAINALEWIAMALPADPKNLLQGVYDRTGTEVTQSMDSLHHPRRAYSSFLFEDDRPKSDPNSLFDIIDYSEL